MPDSYQDPNLTGNYSNPTATPQSGQTFGSSGQFNVQPFAQPFDFGQQSGQNQAFNSQFTDFLSSLETPEATRDRLENRYGYQNLSEDYARTGEAARGVMDQVRGTPESVQQRVNRGGTIVNQGQLDNIVNQDVKGLMETYNALASINEQQGTRLSTIEQNMNEASKLELAQQAKMITPWLQAYDDKNIMQAKEYSGWTFSSQMELNRLLNNQQAGLTWTNAESNRAHQLSLQESSFSHQINMLEKQNEYAVDLWG